MTRFDAFKIVNMTYAVAPTGFYLLTEIAASMQEF